MMKVHTQSKHSTRIWFLFPAALIVIALVMAMLPWEHAAGATLGATYSRGLLRVTIPYHAEHAGAGQLTIEVLNPEDQVLGRLQKRVELMEGKGGWREEIRLEKPLPLEELVWNRLRYRFEYDEQQNGALEGVESISQILRTPVVRIIGQQSYLAGGEAAVRVIVTDSNNDVIPGGGSVNIELTAPERKASLLFTGHVNRRGTTEAQFKFPAGLTGSYQLHYTVDTSIGSTELIQSVKLENKVSILLTTEKPIYQPGQIIHVRALALDRSNHEASSNQRLVFEVEDSRGNKVFKKATETDKFGIASAEFHLADEVNLGTYHLRALMGPEQEEARNTAEIALNVEKYVLPKFKVAVDFATAGNKPKRDYRPGDHVIGTVRANYFFGKPVDGAEIAIKASSMDVAVFDAGSLQGKTDAEGAYHFALKLPDYFAGRPLSQGAARVLIEATVKDSAGHSETRGEGVTVSQSPLLITAVPEGGTLVPNLENQVFILTSYPDGTPAATELTVRATGNSDQHTTTDAGGVAIIRMNAAPGAETLQVEATDKQGNHVSSSLQLQARAGDDQILLRTERAVYRAGDRIQLKIFSTRNHGTAYVDVVKEGQTVLTRDLEIENGQAQLTLAATPDMAGTIDFSAYLFGRNAQPVADHRLLFVQPADELKIEATADGVSYKPGDDAHIRFRVTNSRGEGVAAALGLQVVDEAVFALAEKQPGFAKVFFYLEQEVMKPRYEIHSIGMPDVVEPVDKPEAEKQDRAARALFAATEMVSANKFETEVGRTVPSVKFVDYAQRYQKSFLAQAHRISESLNRLVAQPAGADEMKKAIDKLTREGGSQLRDAWGTKIRIEAAPWGGPNRYYMVHSAGPDKQFSSSDDLGVYLEVRRSRIIGHPSSGASAIDVNLEQDRGPMSEFGSITGTAMDQSGAAVQGATVTVRELSTRKSRVTTTTPDGRFTLAALPSGQYQVEVVTASETVSTRIKLEARNRAILSVFLRKQPIGAVVAVNENMGVGWGGGIGAGAGGGVGGGWDRGIRREAMFAVPAPAKAMALQDVETRAVPQSLNSAVVAKDQPASSAPRVRSYFPEALYINPEIITDREGRASVAIPLADSITTWRMAMMASTQHGALGSATSSIKVFQDFFVDLDLPVTLTQGDRVSIPVAIYNYSESAGEVGLQLQPENWFALVDDTAEKAVNVDSARVGGSQFTIEARRIGKFKLTLSARMKGGDGRADIVVREIEVVPNGRELSTVFNGRLETVARHDLDFPEGAIPDASKVFVRLYPGPLSQVIEGMDSLLRMPYGCFEQTSSSTYPNVLALDYMKRTKKLTPEVHAKAEGYIANGYQRLLTFEVKGGGYSWFGSAPANKILTSYGLMEFYDMSKVYDVDSRMIARTQQWLASEQQPDGSWKPDTYFINEGATTRYNSDLLRITAYIAWSLENTGYQGPAVEKAKQFVEKHMNGKMDPYTLAVLANFAVDYGKDREFTRQAMQLLLDTMVEKGEQAWWTSQETGLYATGESASVETTGLAVQALLKWGQAPGTARKALLYITAKKDSAGTWGTTQATIMALRALLLATEKGAADVRGTVEVVLNGKPVEKLALTPENNDLLHQFVFKDLNPKGGNSVELRFEGKGGLAYQVVGDYFLPWDQKQAGEPLSIDVAYDRTRLAQDDIATATATVRNNLPKAANMIMVDLGIPPGFDLLSEDLQAYQEKSAAKKSGRLEKFNLTATQAILYFDSFAPGETVTLRFRLRAKYPIRARTFKSRVYEYYDPQVAAVARPVQLEVKAR